MSDTPTERRCPYCFQVFLFQLGYAQHLQQHASFALARKWSRDQGLNDNDKQFLKKNRISWGEDT